MRMWCSTSTMLAAARPPAGPAAELGQRVRDSFTGSARLSALAPPWAAHSPPLGRASPAYLRATLDSTSPLVLCGDPHPNPHQLSPPLSLLARSLAGPPPSRRLAAFAPFFARRHSFHYLSGGVTQPLSCPLTAPPTT